MYLNKFINDLDSTEYTEMIQRGGGSMAIVFILLVLVIGGVVGFLFMSGTINLNPTATTAPIISSSSAPKTTAPKTTAPGSTDAPGTVIAPTIPPRFTASSNQIWLIGTRVTQATAKIVNDTSFVVFSNISTEDTINVSSNNPTTYSVSINAFPQVLKTGRNIKLVVKENSNTLPDFIVNPNQIMSFTPDDWLNRNSYTYTVTATIV